MANCFTCRVNRQGSFATYTKTTHKVPSPRAKKTPAGAGPVGVGVVDSVGQTFLSAIGIAACMADRNVCPTRQKNR